MGRELRRKQAKREGKSLQKEVVSEDNQIKKLVKITLLIVFIICVIYIIAALFITKEVDWFDKKEENQSLVTNTILASEIFKQSEEEYYVYFYDYNEEDSEIASAVSSKLSTKKVYKVDTGSALNNNYVSEESNKFAKKLDDLKVKPSTIIKISGEEIVEYYENDEIVNNLK